MRALYKINNVIIYKIIDVHMYEDIARILLCTCMRACLYTCTLVIMFKSHVINILNAETEDEISLLHLVIARRHAPNLSVRILLRQYDTHLLYAPLVSVSP